MKFYKMNNFYSDPSNDLVIGSYWDSALVVDDGDYLYSLGDLEFQDFYNLAKEDSEKNNLHFSLKTYVENLIKAGVLSNFPRNYSPGFQSPIYPDEVWAAGVTYSDSMRERQAESNSPDVYAKVYNADRPEIFFKGTGDRMQPPEDDLGIRKDSGWDVPESELAVVIINGEIAGYTIGNDMSSRSIEGENPLYLPQAKVYNKSFSIGPCIVLPEEIDPQNLKVGLKIFRNDEIVFDGNSSTAEMKRNVIELVDWLQRSNDLPEVAVLMTGTGIIPPQDFTLKQDDIVEISIEKIGTLRNKISLV
ncbi:MAG: fumarylacetoacetate hydrolase family protein [Dehalococcoidia bacterium]|tara:strand:- start:15 stop:926 length:912 start_codon:yes stop_codon:yes gene_type:complete